MDYSLGKMPTTSAQRFSPLPGRIAELGHGFQDYIGGTRKSGVDQHETGLFRAEHIDQSGPGSKPDLMKPLARHPAEQAGMPYRHPAQRMSKTEMPERWWIEVTALF